MDYSSTCITKHSLHSSTSHCLSDLTNILVVKDPISSSYTVNDSIRIRTSFFTLPNLLVACRPHLLSNHFLRSSHEIFLIRSCELCDLALGGVDVDTARLMPCLLGDVGLVLWRTASGDDAGASLPADEDWACCCC
eukprot:scpid94468/ scgid7328/ 